MTNTPQRIQLTRRKGFRLPLQAKSVARPSKWGNPYRVRSSSTHPGDWVVIGEGTFEGRYGSKTAAIRAAVDLYDLHTGPMGDHELDTEALTELRAELGGRDLACYCPIGSPCHGDVLLRLANPDTPATPVEEAHQP